ncbi:hypothetical protein MKY24_03095 [Paenibacillus sp. FSL P2-0322]|uniref:Uncharacterized protein n=1 Tax=Paenibacillus polymyxa TaxID=1406 RepID=A0AAP4EB85_PAEPO|nr:MULTISPECIES: hypothetical protein [Paenibacillus]MDH2332780.1 hypothetical protein [Paenibacillus polymyxa]
MGELLSKIAADDTLVVTRMEGLDRNTDSCCSWLNNFVKETYILLS